MSFLTTWIASSLIRARGKKVLFWTHGWRRRDSGIKRLVRNWFYEIADDLLLYGPQAKEIALDEGFKPSHLHVVFNSSGHEITTPPARIRQSGRQKWIVVSRLIKSRRIDTVIEQAARLGASGRPVDLTVVGEGPAQEDLESVARRHGITVNFLGALYDEAQLTKLLWEADILLSPGHVGLGAIHAMSAGCPVATHGSSQHQMPEFVAVKDGVNGVLFPHLDYETMGEAVWSFVDSHDRALTAKACHDEVTDRWTPQAHWRAMRLGLLRSLTT
jgi:glycosyltransferase involved in cell wall biosynthesis